MLLRPPLLLPSAFLAADLSCIKFVSSSAGAPYFDASDEAAEAHRGLELIRKGRAHARQAPLTDPRPLRKATLKRVQSDDIKVTGRNSSFTRLHGDVRGFAQRLNGDDMLGDPRKASEEFRILEGIVFTRRMVGPSKVWTFRKSDIGKVAALLGTGYDEVILKKIQPNEVMVTHTEADFKRLHGNTFPLAQRLRSDAMLGNPENTKEESKTLNSVVFTRRRSRTRRVWTFHKLDIDKVAALLGVACDKASLKKVQPGEVGVTNHSAEFAMIHGITGNMSRLLNSDEMLGDPEKSELEFRTLKGIVFTRRRNRNSRIWTFLQSDIDRVAALLGVGCEKVPLKDVQPDEIKVAGTDTDLARLHGYVDKLASRLNDDEMLGDPEKAKEESRVIKGIVFIRRRTGTQKIWTFHKSDIAKVADLLGVGYDSVTLKDVQPDEIRVTMTDVEFAMIHGETKYLVKLLKSDQMLGEPQNKKKESKTLKDIVFTRRKNGPQKVWTFRRSDIGRVAALLGVGCDEVILKDIQPGEIRVTHTDAEFAMIYGDKGTLAQRLNSDEMLGDPGKTAEESKTLAGVVFTRRMKHNFRVWTFPSADRYKLERALAKLGIINPNNIYGWHNGIEADELKGMNAETLRDELISFDSNAERQIALILRYYGLIKNFEPGTNLQVKMLDESKFVADFVLKTGSTDMLPTIVLEHHPDYHENIQNLNSREEEFLKALGELDDDQLITGLLEYYSGDIRSDSKDAASRMFLGGYFGTGEIDFYDLRRMAMIQASPLFDEFTRYVRTRTVDDLFDQLIWPLHYEPKGTLNRSEALEEFEKTVQETKAQMERFDATVLPMIFEGEEDID